MKYLRPDILQDKKDENYTERSISSFEDQHDEDLTYTSFRKICEEVKSEKAIELMGDQNLSIGEIAYLVGEYDQSTFAKSFKKWTGLSPSDFRKKMNQAA